MTNIDEDPQNVTEGQPHSPAASGLVDRFDRELGEWFALHGGVWCGTAAELLAALRAGVEVTDEVWPRSPRALHAHIESHQQILHSLGMAVLLSGGHPRMISIRSCQNDQPERTPPPATPEIKETPCQEPRTIRSSTDEGVSDSTAETLIEMLKTSTPSESSMPSSISKLAAAPAHLRTAFKRAWMRRPRAM